MLLSCVTVAAKMNYEEHW